MAALASFSLPAPSFVKVYFVSRLREGERVPGLAALAVTEALGGVLGPVVIRHWQIVSSGNGSVFFGEAGLVGLAVILFGLGTCFQ
jgi:hypothetical protein